MEQGDIIRITDVQRQVGYQDEILNVYHYLVFSMTTPGDLQVYSEDLANRFFADVMTPIIAIQSNQVTHTELRFWNLSNQAEEAVYAWPTPIPGDNVQEPLPAQNTYSFKLIRYSRLVRNGRKGIAGIPEAAVTNGKELIPAFDAPVQDVAEALAMPLVSNLPDFTATLSPVIVRIPSNPGVTPTVFTTVLLASYTGIGTQNSRKEF